MIKPASSFLIMQAPTYYTCTT